MLLRQDMLGGMYEFSYAFMDNRLLNLPFRRPWLYCIAVRRDSCCLKQSSNALADELPPVTALTCSGLDYLCFKDSGLKLTPHLERNLAGYKNIFGPTANAFDLAQTPECRPPALLKLMALPVITRGCRLYSSSHQRFLSGREDLIAQG